MRKIIFLVLVWLGAMILVGCSPSPVAKLDGMTLTLSRRVLNQSDNKVDIFVQDASGSPVSDATVSCEMTHLTMRMDPVVVSAINQGEGRYTAILTPTMDGPWTLSVNVERDRQFSGTAEFKVYVNVPLQAPAPHMH